MIRASLAAMALVVLALAGCSSGSKAGTSGPTCDKACQFSSIEAELSSSASAPDNGLTGFGASLDSWNAHHDADPDPNLDAGCCYLPKIDTAGDSNVDTWQISLQGAQMTFYTRNFPAETSEQAALSALASDDLPPDAKLVQSGTDGACRNLLYSSALIGDALSDSGGHVTVTLFSPAQADPYDGNNVEQAQLVDGNEFSAPC